MPGPQPWTVGTDQLHFLEIPNPFALRKRYRQRIREVLKASLKNEHQSQQRQINDSQVSEQSPAEVIEETAIHVLPVASPTKPLGSNKNAFADLRIAIDQDNRNPLLILRCQTVAWRRSCRTAAQYLHKRQSGYLKADAKSAVSRQKQAGPAKIAGPIQILKFPSRALTHPPFSRSSRASSPAPRTALSNPRLDSFRICHDASPKTLYGPALPRRVLLA